MLNYGFIDKHSGIVYNRGTGLKTKTITRRKTIMFNMQKVAERIMLARKEKGLTQMELANKLGVSFQAISNWERGVAMPDISNLEPLADALGTTVDDIISDRKVVSLIRNGEIPNEISIDEFNTVSPLLEPDQNEKLIKKIRNTGDGSEQINTESLCLTEGKVAQLALKAYEKGDCVLFALMIRKCSPDFICAMFRRAYAERNTAMFAIMRRHVPDELLHELLDKSVEDGYGDLTTILLHQIYPETEYDEEDDLEEDEEDDLEEDEEDDRMKDEED